MLFIFGIPQSVRGETGETLLFVHRNLLIGVKRTPLWWNKDLAGQEVHPCGNLCWKC